MKTSLKLPSLKMSARAAMGAGAAVAALTFAPGASANERYAAYVVDVSTQDVLLADNAYDARFPASLTKMMTLHLLFDALERGEITLTERMPVSRFAALQPPSKLGLRRGETISVEDAIEALVSRSANDVAVVVAERLGGTESRFAQKMTARARELGMFNTIFVNASGLPDPSQRTTAHDMARLGGSLFKTHNKYYSYFGQQGMTWRARFIRNHNGLLGRVNGVDGIKTGYTRASGFNLTSSVERNGQRIIAVVMGGESAAVRDAQMEHIIEGAFEELNKRQAAPTATFVSLPVMRVAVEFSETGEIVAAPVAAPAAPTVAAAANTVVIEQPTRRSATIDEGGAE